MRNCRIHPLAKPVAVVGRRGYYAFTEGRPTTVQQKTAAQHQRIRHRGRAGTANTPAVAKKYWGDKVAELVNTQEWKDELKKHKVELVRQS